MPGPGFDIIGDILTAAKLGIGILAASINGKAHVYTAANEDGLTVQEEYTGPGVYTGSLYYGVTRRGDSVSDHYNLLLLRNNGGAGAVTKFVVRGDGNVGIGTPNPGEKLEVNGKVKASDNVVLDNGGNDSPGVVVRSKNTTGQTIDGVANGQYFPDWYMDHYTSAMDPSEYGRLRFIRGAKPPEVPTETVVMTLDPQGTLRLIGKVNVSGRDAIDAQGYCLYG